MASLDRGSVNSPQSELSLRRISLKPNPSWVRTRASMIGRLPIGRSEEHTPELQSLMRTSYAVFCLKHKTVSHDATNRATRKKTRLNYNNTRAQDIQATAQH